MDCDHNLISSEGGQDTSTMQNFRPFPPCVFPANAGNLSGRTDKQTDQRTDGRACRKTVTVDWMDQRSHVQVKRRYFRLRADGWTDGQPENIMPTVPKGGSIKIGDAKKQFAALKRHQIILVQIRASVALNMFFWYKFEKLNRKNNKIAKHRHTLLWLVREFPKGHSKHRAYFETWESRSRDTNMGLVLYPPWCKDMIYLYYWCK